MVEKKLEYGDIVVAHACTFSLGKCGLSGSKPFVFRSVALVTTILDWFNIAATSDCGVFINYVDRILRIFDHSLP